MQENLLVAILGGIVIWFTTNIVGFFLRRHRLAKALIEDINHRISTLYYIKEFLDEYFKNSVIQGAILKNYADNTKDKFPFFEDIRGDLYKYFGASNLIAIMRCYEALEEIQILMENLCQDFCKHYTLRTALSEEDVNFFNRRKERVKSIIAILGRSGVIHSISDLPRDYKGMMTAVEIIRK